MPFTTAPPSRKANSKRCWLITVCAIAFFWPATAISLLHGEESVIQWATNPTLRLASHLALDLFADQRDLSSPEENTEVIATPDHSAASEEKVHSRCHVGLPLSSLASNISLPGGSLPENFAGECAATQPPTIDRRIQEGWAMTDRHWAATGLRHRPLYFEEINAERYGYSASYLLQPVISATRFFLTIPALPYKMAVDRPHDCQYTLGHYRPGSCVPRRRNRLPLKVTGAIAQVGVVAGLILLIP